MPRFAPWLGGLLIAWLSIWGLGGPRTYPMSAFGALFCLVLLGPTLLVGFYSLRRLLAGNREELEHAADEIGSAIGGLGGMPLVVLSPLWAFIVLAVARGIGRWDLPAKGSLLDVAFAVIALHLVVWGAMLGLGWAVRKDD
jgi:hypothetical protein